MSTEAHPPKDRSWREDHFATREVFGHFSWMIWVMAALVAAAMFPLLNSVMANGRGQVIAYCAQDQEYAEPILREFSKQTGIKARAVYDNEAVKTVGLANRLLAERPHPQCDVFWGNEELRTRQLAAQHVFRETNGWAGVGYRSRCIVINTNRLSLGAAPRSLLELTNENWRGKVALAYPQFGTTATHFHALRQHWGDERWQAWCRALAVNKPLLVDGNSVVVKMVGRGEAWIGLTDSDDVASGQGEGLPLAPLPMGEETLLIPNTIAVVRGAPHPEAAQRLFDYLQQREVLQGLVAAHALEGYSGSTVSIPTLKVNWDDLLRDLQGTTAELSRIFLEMNWLLLKNSLLVGGLTTLLAGSFGSVAALWLAGLERRWRNRFLAVAVMALALPPFLVTNCWLDLLGYAGVWRGWLPLNIVSLSGTIWILSLLTWPITLLMVLSAWQRLEPSQLESDVAVTGWWLIRGLLWPLGRTALAQAAVLTFVLAMNNFAVPAILQVKVFPAEMWVRFNTTFDTLGALRLSWPLVVAPLLLLLWFARREFPWPRMEGPVSARLFRQQLGPGWFWLCGTCTIVLCLLAVGLPVFQLVSVQRTWTELPGALAAGQSALWNSFFLAAAAAAAVVVFGLFASVRLSAFGLPSGFGFRLSDLCRWLAWLPLLLPGVLLGIGLIVLFNRPGFALLYQSAAIVVLAFVIRYLAVGWNSLAHALQTVDRDLTDLARLDGATRWQMLRFVQWPQIAPRAAAAWYIVFLLCLWDVESMILVVPPGGETLALRVFNLLHYGHNAQVNALCLTLLALAVLPLVLWKVWCLVRVTWSAPTHHAPRATVLASCVLALILTGCTPSAPPNQAPLQSRLFRSVQIIGSRGVGVGQLNKPRSVAVDAQDNLYVVDMTGRVQKFSSNGVFLLSWQMPQTDLGKPKGMCRDRDGNIIVLEPHYQRLNVFSPDGKLLAQWGKSGTNAGEFTLPRAVAVDSRGEVFVSEYSVLDRVQRFAARGDEALANFGHSGNAPGEFNRPEGLCVDAQDRLYVADSCNHRIQVFSSDGKFIRTYGKAGRGKGDLSYPYDICVDAAGRQYVCEFGNSRIQVFDANDQPLEIIGGPGLAPGQFNNPWGVALDSAGNLYVADSQNHRVQKLIR